MRRWPNIKPTFGECAVFAGKVLPANMRGGQLFLAPHSNTTFASQPSTHLRALDIFFTPKGRSSISNCYEWETYTLFCVGYETHIPLLSCLVHGLMTGMWRDMSLWNIHRPLSHSGNRISCIF